MNLDPEIRAQLRQHATSHGVVTIHVPPADLLALLDAADMLDLAMGGQDICIFCGYTTARDIHGGNLKAHIEVCPEHPLVQARKALRAISEWDMLNPPQTDRVGDLGWLRGLVDVTLKQSPRWTQNDDGTWRSV